MNIRKISFLIKITFILCLLGCEKDENSNSEKVYSEYYRTLLNERPDNALYGTPAKPSWGFVNTTADESIYRSLDGLSGTELYQELKKIASVDIEKTSYSRNRYTATDEDPRNRNNVILLYKGTSVSKNDVNSWNREHVFACYNGNFDRDKKGAAMDNHHIRCSDPEENMARGHLKFGIGYSPRDAVKGDIARMSFYISLIYNVKVQNNIDISKAVQWNIVDKVDDWEVRRNNVIQKLQGNRNPFIDHPELVDYIYGDRKNEPFKFTNHNYVFREDNKIIEDNNENGNKVQEIKVIAKDLFISEYAEGSASNKYIELFNATGSDVDLSDYNIKIGSGGKMFSDKGAKITKLDGTVKNGSVFVIINEEFSLNIPTDVYVSKDFTSATYFSGDDAIALYKGDKLVDIVGIEGDDPGDAWSIGEFESATKDHTLIRKPYVKSPSVNWKKEEWSVLSMDDISNIGQHSYNPK